MGVREHRPRVGAGAEGNAIQRRLRRHKELMDGYVCQGMTREDASKKAFDEIVRKPS